MPALTLLGDVVWILALSVMAQATRAAWLRIAPETKVPMSFRQDGSPGLRLGRNIALLALPTAGFVVGLLLVVFNRNMAAQPQTAPILFGVRVVAAGLVAVAHTRWLQAALETLKHEGALKE